MPPLHLLVIAHPDDESMFFSPLLSSLPPADARLLSLTDGDHPPSVGAVRRRELLKAAKEFGIEPGHVKVADLAEAGVFDSPSQRWPNDPIHSFLEGHLSGLLAGRPGAPVLVYTFDEAGVSGHANHADTFLALRAFYYGLPLSAEGGRAFRDRATGLAHPLELHALHTYPPLLKYLPPPPLSPLPLYAALLPPHSFVCGPPPLAAAALSAHASQLLWYRRLFVRLSSYSHTNLLLPLPPAPSTGPPEPLVPAAALLLLLPPSLVLLDALFPGLPYLPGPRAVLLSAAAAVLLEYTGWLGRALFERNG